MTYFTVQSSVQDIWTGGQRAVAGRQHRQTRQCVGCWLVERQVWFAGLADFSCSLLFWGTVSFFSDTVIYLFRKIWRLEPLGLWYLWLFSCSTWFGEWLLTVRHMFLESWFLCFKGWCSPSQSGCLCSHRPQSGGLHWLWSRERADLLQPC